MFPQNSTSLPVYSPSVTLGGGGGGGGGGCPLGGDLHSLFIYNTTDHILPADSPISPNSQFMYELDLDSVTDCFTALPKQQPTLGDCFNTASCGGYADDALMMCMKSNGLGEVCDNLELFNSSVESLSFIDFAGDAFNNTSCSTNTGVTAPPDCLMSYGSVDAVPFDTDCDDCFDWDGKSFEDFDVINAKTEDDDPRLSAMFAADGPTLTQLNSRDLWLCDEFDPDDGLLSDTAPSHTEGVVSSAGGSESYYGSGVRLRGSSDSYSTERSSCTTGRMLNSTIDTTVLSTLSTDDASYNLSAAVMGGSSSFKKTPSLTVMKAGPQCPVGMGGPTFKKTSSLCLLKGRSGSPAVLPTSTSTKAIARNKSLFVNAPDCLEMSAWPEPAYNSSLSAQTFPPSLLTTPLNVHTLRYVVNNNKNNNSNKNNVVEMSPDITQQAMYNNSPVFFLPHQFLAQSHTTVPPPTPLLRCNVKTHILHDVLFTDTRTEPPSAKRSRLDAVSTEEEGSYLTSGLNERFTDPSWGGMDVSDGRSRPLQGSVGQYGGQRGQCGWASSMGGNEQPSVMLIPMNGIKLETIAQEDQVDLFQTISSADPLLRVKTEQDTAAVQREGVSDVDDSDEENDSEEEGNVSDAGSNRSNNLSEFMTSPGHKSASSKRYFWQYNTQAKGPKGKRLCKTVRSEDPHVLHDFEDPVFDPEQNQTRYKHNGKARRGDGNDITPNAYKLYTTGNELTKLNKLINSISPPTDLPAPARPRSLKEKNKYASRACRLKKKAQHEANKLKLHGLDQEHRQLMNVLTTIKTELVKRISEDERLPPSHPSSSHRGDGCKEKMTTKLDNIMQRHLTLMIAGHTADYVNTVLQKVAEGDRTGGLTFED